MNNLPEIPTSWLIAILMIGLVALRAFGIDTWTTAALSIIIGYLTGVKQEQIRKVQQLAVGTKQTVTTTTEKNG